MQEMQQAQIIEANLSPIRRTEISSGLGKINVLQGQRIFFDVKTTGFPERQGWDMYNHPKLLQSYDQARVYEVGYILCDEKNQILKTVASLIKPNGFSINKPFQGAVTTEMAMKIGKSLQDFVKEFASDIQGVDHFVSHNAMNKIHSLLSEVYRQQDLCEVKADDLLDYFSKSNIICLMNTGKKFYKADKRDKVPKLSELYADTFGVEITTDHKAATDCGLMKDCYMGMVSNSKNFKPPAPIPFNTYGGNRTYSNDNQYSRRYNPYQKTNIPNRSSMVRQYSESMPLAPPPLVRQTAYQM